MYSRAWQAQCILWSKLGWMDTLDKVTYEFGREIIQSHECEEYEEHGRTVGGCILNKE